MSGWPLKYQARIVGIDDGPYIRGSDRTPIVLTLMRLDGYLDGIHISDIGTDGIDSSTSIMEALESSGFIHQTRAILSDGACLGGFNVLDMDDLNRSTGIPVITCSDSEPETDSMKRALEKHFDDWKERLSLVTRNEPGQVDLPDGACYIRCSGITRERAEWIVRRNTVRGRMPEVLRISHMIAHSLKDRIR